MRNLLAVPVVLSMMFVPGMYSTANAGVAVSVEASAGYPAPEYGYSDYANTDVDWNNAFVINDNQIGMWVWLPVGRWVLRCCNIWYDSGWNEVRFGPWWYDYSVPYTYHYDNMYFNYCPFRTVRFHDYMNQHYPQTGTTAISSSAITGTSQERNVSSSSTVNRIRRILLLL